MAVPTSPSPSPRPQITVTEYRKSEDSMRRTSDDSHRTSSSSTHNSQDETSAPIPSPYSRIPVYGNDASRTHLERAQTEEKVAESLSSMEEERRKRKRDYAIQISRIMGRQLVSGISKGSKTGAAAGSGAAG